MQVKKMTCFILIVILLPLAKLNAQTTADSCTIAALPSVVFKQFHVMLSAEGKKILDVAYTIIQQAPACKINVIGYTGMSEAEQQTSWDRVYSVVSYLVAKGVDKKRIIFTYGMTGDTKLVDLVATTEDGPNTVPAPMPCYSYHKLTPKRCKNFH